MLYAKIIDDKIIYASSSSKLVFEEKTTINPKEEDFFNAGFSTLPTSEKPASEEGFFYVSKYEIVEGVIAQVWTKYALESDDISSDSTESEGENESI